MPLLSQHWLTRRGLALGTSEVPLAKESLISYYRLPRYMNYLLYATLAGQFLHQKYQIQHVPQKPNFSELAGLES